jgi:hypothetical protein
LDFHAPVPFFDRAQGLIPAQANGFNARQVEIIAFDEQASDLQGPVFAQVQSALGRLLDKLIAPFFSEFLHHGIVDVATQEHRGARADVQQLLDDFEISLIFREVELQGEGVGLEQKTNHYCPVISH